VTSHSTGASAPVFHLPDDIRHFPDLSSLSAEDRAKFHTKQLSAVAFFQGIEGTAKYKQQHPEAANHRVNVRACAYLPKPKGYDDYLVSLVHKWLTDDTSVLETNTADVERLNVRFGTGRFNPANHFSKPLSPSRLRKLKDKFLEHGVHLDTSKANTLSKIKAVARNAYGRLSGRRSFGRIGSIDGSTLTLGNHRFAIMQHHGRDAIKLSVHGQRLWLRLDVMAAVIDLVDGPVGVPPPITTTCSIGELVPEAETGDDDPLAITEAVELVPVSQHLPIGEPVPSASEPPSLAQRIAALKGAQPSSGATALKGADPLLLN